MKAIPTETRYSRQTYLILTSRILERASFYGIRGLLIMYVINRMFFKEGEAMSVYGWFAGSITFSILTGAALGDLLLGNKKAMLIGGFIQTFGAFALCVPSVEGLYTGIICLSLGSGLYTPNMLSLFGKAFSKNEALLDGGFSMLYLSVNLGAFVGTMLMSFLGHIDFIFAFAIAGILMAASTAMIFFTGEVATEPKSVSTVARNRNSGIVIGAIVLLAIFWATYRFAMSAEFEIEHQMAIPRWDYPLGIWELWSGIFVYVIGIVFILIWTFYHTPTRNKMAAGFLLAAISCGLLILTESLLEKSILVLGVFMMSAAEMLIGPMLYSILVKRSNPKYLAIVIGLSFIPTALIFYLPGVDGFDDFGDVFPLLISTAVFTVIGIGLSVFSGKSRS